MNSEALQLACGHRLPIDPGACVGDDVGKLQEADATESIAATCSMALKCPSPSIASSMIPQNDWCVLCWFASTITCTFPILSIPSRFRNIFQGRLDRFHQRPPVEFGRLLRPLPRLAVHHQEALRLLVRKFRYKSPKAFVAPFHCMNLVGVSGQQVREHLVGPSGFACEDDDAAEGEAVLPRGSVLVDEAQGPRVLADRSPVSPVRHRYLAPSGTGPGFAGSQTGFSAACPLAIRTIFPRLVSSWRFRLTALRPIPSSI